MDEKIRLVTELAVARTLQEFALKLGVGEEFADILSQIHVKSSTILHNWMKFIESNCAGCSHNPDSCVFFHPTEEDCSAGATPESTSRANRVVVESGVMRKCPVFERIRRSSP